MRRLLGLPVLALFLSAAVSTPVFADTKADKAAQELAKKEEKARLAAEKKAAEEAKKAEEAAKKAEKEAAKKAIAKKNDPNEIGNRDVGKGINFYSIEKEIAMGKSLAQEVERQAKIVDDPIIAEYVNRVGQNLVRNSDCQVPFTIKMVEDESVNAFALPGGFFFVNSGLFLKAQTEAEVAGVMAHEIAHVCARHGTRQDTKGQIASYATLPMIFMGGGWGAYAMRQAAQVLIPLGFLKFSRAYEQEADNLGLQYMYKTGYDPVAFVDFFEKIQAMEKTKKGTISQYFSSHPPTDSRITNAQKNIQANLEARPEYMVTTSEFNKVKTRLAMLENRRKVDDKSGANDRPTLKQKPGSTKDDTGADDKDERPKLERR
jgi:beta-barrel assembly-enhancing protease